MKSNKTFEDVFIDIKDIFNVHTIIDASINNIIVGPHLLH